MLMGAVVMGAVVMGAVLMGAVLMGAVLIGAVLVARANRYIPAPLLFASAASRGPPRSHTKVSACRTH